MVETNLKHYLSDFGHARDVAHHEEDSNELIDILVPVWNDLVAKNLSKEDHSKAFMSYLKDFEWEVHGVAYDLEMSETLNGIGGGPKVDELFTKPDEQGKRVLLNCLKRWKEAGYYRAEFLLYLHDTLMTIGFNMFLSERGSSNGSK